MLLDTAQTDRHAAKKRRSATVHGRLRASLAKLRGPSVAVVLVLATVTGSLSLQTSSRAAAVYPLKVSDNKRYLVDQTGKPYLLAADTAWTLTNKVTTAEAAQYLDTRKKQGFNTVLVSLVDITMGSVANTRTRSGMPLFEGGIGNPNPAYFDHVDAILGLARDRGMQLIVLPLWLGFADKDGSFNTDSASAYGRFLGERYRAHDNLIWSMGGDYGDAQSGYCPRSAEVMALANAIKAADDRHLMTYHTGANYSSNLCYGNAPWLDISATYWDFNFRNMASSYKAPLQDYDYTPVKPTFMMETGYEGPHPGDANPDANALTAKTSRQQSYYMMLSGSFGFTYGADNTYAMAAGVGGRSWQHTLEIPGGFHQGHVAKLFNERAGWWSLVPDRNRTVLTGGNGDFGSNDYALAARSDNGHLVVAYTPSPRTLKIHMPSLSGLSTASWYDPTNATYKVIGSGLANSGTKSFTTPGNNAEGHSDWVLVLETDQALLN